MQRQLFINIDVREARKNDENTGRITIEQLLISDNIYSKEWN